MFQAIYAEQDGLARPQLKRSVQTSCYYEGKELFPSNMTDATQKIEYSSRSTSTIDPHEPRTKCFKSV